LTANQISVETDTTGFTALASALARASGGLIGTYCLQVTCSAANGGFTMEGGASSGTAVVTPGSTYTFTVSAKAASITRTVYAKVFWWQGDGTTAASTVSDTGTGVALSTAWQEVTVTAVAPANATKASLQVYAAASANAEVYLVDRLGFWVSGGGQPWSATGPGAGAYLSLLGALNKKAAITVPTSYLGLNAVCNQLASTTGLDAVSALRAIP
jgi:hypothetical protein